MRRRPRIDLGTSHEQSQQQSAEEDKNEAKLERKRKRWAFVNKNRPPEENPFLAAIKPDHDNYGEPNESAEQLRARLASLEFGNYPGYFNYRNKAATTSKTDEQAAGQEAPETGSTINGDNPREIAMGDQRLTLMKEEWFKNKSVLDVGCNRGHITYAIAKLFLPKFILGIDIDLKMIHMANRDLHLHLEGDLLRANIELRIKRANEMSDGLRGTTGGQDTGAPDQMNKPQGDLQLQDELYTEELQHFALSSYVAQGPLACSLPKPRTRLDCDSEDKTREGQEGHEKIDVGSPTDNRQDFPNNILFIEHNYVLSNDELVARQRPYFDTIVCLSVTKWIHLNYRDDGLKRFFRRMYNHLNDGGLLILEVQPFDNYHRKKKLSDRLRSNFNSIKFKPDHFDDFLLSDQVGFKEIVFSTTTGHECAGFKRPMKVFLK